MSEALVVNPLTAAGFSAFGDVIETSGHTPIQINHGQTMRFDNLAKLALTEAKGRPTLNIFRTKPMVRPITLHQMERHLIGSQSFIPLSGRPWLVVVAPKGQFQVNTIKAFLASGRQGVNFAPGTWHHFSLALDQTSDFLVIDRAGDGADCEEVQLDPPLLVERLS